MGLFGSDYNVDWKRLDGQQSHIYREGKNDGLELAIEIAERHRAKEVAEELRKLRYLR